MIEIRNLDFSYKKTAVFHNISLTFAPGSIYGLLGENGESVVCKIRSRAVARWTVE